MMPPLLPIHGGQHLPWRMPRRSDSNLCQACATSKPSGKTLGAEAPRPLRLRMQHPVRMCTEIALRFTPTTKVAL